jgi:hypothetical protein
MTLVVEDGTGRAAAQSYVSVEDADAFYSAQLNEGWFVDEPSKKEAALIRATAFIDATYRARFPGYPTRGRAQALEWPRRGAYTYVPDNGRSSAYFDANTGAGYDQGYTYLPVNEIPRELRAAVCEAAMRELAKPGSLAPDLKRGGAIKSAGAGSARVEFFGNAPAGTTFQAIDLALGALLMPASPYSGRAVRG